MQYNNFIHTSVHTKERVQGGVKDRINREENK